MIYRFIHSCFSILLMYTLTSLLPYCLNLLLFKPLNASSFQHKCTSQIHHFAFSPFYGTSSKPLDKLILNEQVYDKYGDCRNNDSCGDKLPWRIPLAYEIGHADRQCVQDLVLQKYEREDKLVPVISPMVFDRLVFRLRAK